MSQKLSVNSFKWRKKKNKFFVEFITNYDKESDKGQIIEVNVRYSKKRHKVHSDLTFLPEGRKTGKYEKLVYNLHNKETQKPNIDFERNNILRKTSST